MENPEEDGTYSFTSQDECLYNVHLIVFMVLIAGSLTYFPLKIHFSLVLRANWKQGLEQDEIAEAQESARNARLAAQKRREMELRELAR